MIIVREFGVGDLPEVSSLKLRHDDHQEILAASGCNPSDVLRRSALEGEVCRVAVAEDTGNIVTIWGLSYCDEDEQVGYPWMVGTDEMLRHRRDILRLGKEQTADFLKRRPVLINMMDSRNVTHKRWLQWIGYVFTGQTTIINDFMFEYFELRRNQCATP